MTIVGAIELALIFGDFVGQLRPILVSYSFYLLLQLYMFFLCKKLSSRLGSKMVKSFGNILVLTFLHQKVKKVDIAS